MVILREDLLLGGRRDPRPSDNVIGSGDGHGREAAEAVHRRAVLSAIGGQYLIGRARFALGHIAETAERMVMLR